LNKSIISAIALSLLSIPGANAEDKSAKSFLEALAGEFRGRGEVLVGPAKNQERVSCRLLNSFDQSALSLKISGKCATTQGKVSVDGTLKLDNNNTIIGSFLSTSKDTKVTQSTSTLNDGKLILSISMVNNKTGSLSKTRQVVSKNDKGGFDSVFLRFDNASGSYEETGKVEFVSKGD